MARSIWRGAISFGMVSIPVRLFTATESKDVAFRQLHGDVVHVARALAGGWTEKGSSKDGVLSIV